MILHLVNDEKIINRTIDVFDTVYPDENLFVVANRASNNDFKSIVSKKNVLSRNEFLKNGKNLEYSKIFIHFLNTRKIQIIKSLKLPESTKIYWIVWGADLYNNLLEPKGFEMIDKESTYLKNQNLFQRFYGKFRKFSKKTGAKEIVNFIQNKVNYIVTDTTENDYDYLLKYYPRLKNKEWKDFFYYPIDIILGECLMDKWVDDKNILIGNSASQTNNHEYVMRILKNFNVSGRQIIVPLSYSDKHKYAKHIIEYGKKLFGNDFKPLLKFVPLAEYNKIMTSTSIVLFGNWRQEAIGNILIALYLGARVCLPKRSPVYEWAQTHNLKVFDIEKLTQKQLDNPLNAEDRLKNRKILTDLYNSQRMYELIRDL